MCIQCAHTHTYLCLQQNFAGAFSFIQACTEAFFQSSGNNHKYILTKWVLEGFRYPAVVTNDLVNVY